jgi:hypothetical protein
MIFFWIEILHIHVCENIHRFKRLLDNEASVTESRNGIIALWNEKPSYDSFFTVSAPEAPSDIRIRTVETYVDNIHNMTAGNIWLSWKPPPNVSLTNRISVYRVNFRKVAPLHYLKYLTPHVNVTEVPGVSVHILRLYHVYVCLLCLCMSICVIPCLFLSV